MQNGVGPPEGFRDRREVSGRVFYPRDMPRPKPLIDLDLGDTDIWGSCSGQVLIISNDLISAYRFYDGSVPDAPPPPWMLIHWLRLDFERAREWNTQELETARRGMSVFDD